MLLFSSFTSGEKKHAVPESVIIKNASLYERLCLSDLDLKEAIFEKAFKGWNSMIKKDELCNSHLLSIIDLSQSANLKRLYIIDIEKGEVLFNTYVAHGRNSGEEFAKSFSNKTNSYKSSLGFYITGNTYNGKNGLSLHLKGVESGINNFAEKRSIVMHGASYVSEPFIKENGHLGRSLGCPVVPLEFNEAIVNLLKDGSCLFIYYPDAYYLKKSRFK